MGLYEQLKSDLSDKLDQWRWVMDQPAMCIEDYFRELKNEIDVAIEGALATLSGVAGRTDEYQALNASRKIMIDEIEQHRKSLMEFVDILKYGVFWKDSERVFKQVGRDIEALSPEMANLEEEYLRLALTILQQKSKLEEQALGSNLPFFHLEQSGQSILVFLNGVSYSRFDQNCFKELLRDCSSDFTASLNTLKRLKQEELEKYLRVPYRQSSEIDAKMLCIVAFAKFIKDAIKASPQQLLVRIRGLASLTDHTRTLCLGSQDLTKLDIPFAFVRSIETLDLSDNRISNFDSDFFVSLTSLKTLILVNAFQPEANMTIDFLKRLAKLEELKLTLPDTFSSDFLGAFNLSVLWLYSASTRNSSLEKTVMSETLISKIFCNELTDLKLCGFQFDLKQLERLPAFLGRIGSHIKSLDLSNNSLTSFPGSCFVELTSLESLSLRGNLLRSLPANIFNGLIQLDKLDLSGNAISDLPSGIFDHLTQLTDLDLSNNKLKRLSRGLFQRLPAMETLKLSNNLLAHIDIYDLYGFRQLRVLDLSHCQLKAVEVNIFETMKELRTLDLSNNQIGTIALRLEHLNEPIAFNSARLGDEQVSLVKKHLFATYLTKLEIIKLNNNQFVEFNLICFHNLRYLLEIDLSNNLIARIGNHRGDTNPSLSLFQKIRFSGNQLQTVEDGLVHVSASDSSEPGEIFLLDRPSP